MKPLPLYPVKLGVAAVKSGPFAGDRPRREKLLLQQGEGEETAHKKQYDLSLIAILRKMRGKMETGTNHAPELPPERLLNCVSTTSSRAPRLMEPARGVPPITAALPPAAGQWRRSGFCVRRWLGFVCASFRCAPRRKSRPGAVRLGGGSAAPPPPGRGASAPA
ncbi:hypothetical protein J1605_017959 [Eschrichtius robustus]|uniref:Uncharacterized protein n=1 Tax=Eschrichtius robustus TaxID=9764 RepID=A0AB34HYL7_ESCRO|nr:hypothetical protein J1605_017959 [Eschrichtius robustus]